jgi:hypothetical protein
VYGQRCLRRPQATTAYYFSPAELLEMKLSFVPNEKNEVLLAVLLMPAAGCYWMVREMTSRTVKPQELCKSERSPVSVVRCQCKPMIATNLRRAVLGTQNLMFCPPVLCRACLILLLSCLDPGSDRLARRPQCLHDRWRLSLQPHCDRGSTCNLFTAF